MPRTTSQFLASTVATTLATTTGPLEEAAFPKIALRNSYQIRWERRWGFSMVCPGSPWCTT